MSMTIYVFEGANGFGRWTATARGRDEEEAAQRIARRKAGRKAGAYPTAVEGETGWQRGWVLCTPDGPGETFRCTGVKGPRNTQ
jgi:hypothetical protein